MSEENNQWERKLLEKLASEALVEQRRKRRWGIFFKLIGLVYVGILIASVLGLTTTPSLEVSRHTLWSTLMGSLPAIVWPVLTESIPAFALHLKAKAPSVSFFASIALVAVLFRQV